MATVSGQGTTFNLPNFTGELFNIAPSDTPLLSAIGGLNGGRTTTSREFEWQTEGLEASSANNTKKEGEPAPNASEVDRQNVTNVVEIHQEAVEISYTKLAAVGQLNGIAVAGANQPVDNELQHQLMLKMKKIAIDVEQSFLNGVYAKPSDNSAPRKTRGLISAIATNVFAAGGVARDLSVDIVNSALAGMYDNGAPLPQDTTVIMVGPTQKMNLSKIYTTDSRLNQPTMTRNIGGVNIDTIVTDFGTFGVMLNRYMPASKVVITDLAQLHPVFLDVPGKGHLFAEPLAKTGASEKWQVYGEIGLMYGPESYHGVIGDLN